MQRNKWQRSPLQRFNARREKCQSMGARNAEQVQPTVTVVVRDVLCNGRYFFAVRSQMYRRLTAPILGNVGLSLHPKSGRDPQSFTADLRADREKSPQGRLKENIARHFPGDTPWGVLIRRKLGMNFMQKQKC